MPKVLVVHDSQDVRSMVEPALVAKHMDVLWAASGTKAIDQIGREEPDLIVCDVGMPDIDGYQICQYVKTHRHLRHTPVLLISAVVDSAVVERAATVNADDLLRQPFAVDQLVRKIQNLLESVATHVPAVSAPRLAAPAAPFIEWTEAPEVAGPPAVSPAADRLPSMPDLKTVLATLAALPGVTLSMVVDREGFLIESAGDMILEADVAGALAGCLAESSLGIGHELGQGRFQGMILEYENGLVLLNELDATAMLAVVARDSAVLGKIRYYAKKAVPELLAAL
jgi:CheY-like chemotaxis protein/predicted regulator of Ras-like GTPase activity (Roadblock/LC7/MglB family)